MLQPSFAYFDMRINRINKTGERWGKLDNPVYWNRGFTLIELTITVAMVGILAAIAVPNYTDYIKKTKLVACSGDTRILNLEYTVGQTGDYTSTTDLKDELLTEFGFTNVSDGVYNCPSCDDDVYANVSLDADDKLETSCSLEADVTTSEAEVDDETETETETVSEAEETATESTTISIQAVLDGFDVAYDNLTGWPSGDKLIAAYGVLATVDSTLTDKTLYWKANTFSGLINDTTTTDTSQKYILFATADSDTTSHSQWKSSLAYYDGVYYKSTSTTSGTSSVAVNPSSTTSSGVSAWLLANGWVVAE